MFAFLVCESENEDEDDFRIRYETESPNCSRYFKDVEQKVRINDEITVSYFKNISCWFWRDDRYEYTIYLRINGKGVTHEQIFDMIREYYGVK